MHNYNPPHKYSLKTRIGNWSEEWDLQENNRKEYIRRKQQGLTNVNQKQQTLSKSYQSASLTYSKDAFRKFGDHVMLFNGKVEGFLVTDIFEKTSSTEQGFNISAVKNIHAAARSVFILERADPNDGFKDNVIHFGQHLHIRINPLLIDKPVYLYSQPASINRYSKVSRLQQVVFLLKNNFNTIWVLEHPDPNLRLESAGQPITLDQTVLIKHQMTNQWLAAVEQLYQNSFGKEYQVLAHNFLVNNKTQNLYQEKKGISTIDIAARSQKDENLWLILGAATADQEFDQSIVKNEVVNKFTLEKKFKHLLTERGVYGMRFIHKIMSCLDTNRSGILDEQDFRWGLHSGKVFLSEQEIQFLLKTYGNNGQIAYRQLLNDLRGKLNNQRYKSIIEAYNRIGKLVSNKYTLEELGKVFDAKRHPQVITNKKTEQQAFNEFIWSWDNIKPDYVVQLEQFAAYFEDLSCMIPRDQHFEYLLLSIFHL